MSYVFTHIFSRGGFRVAVLTALCAFGLPAAAATRIVLGDNSATVSSSYMTESADRAAKWAVNGAGLTGEQHASDTANAKMWMSNTKTTPSAQWFKIDLGAVYPLHSLKLWNFNWKIAADTDYTDRGVNQCDLYVSASETNPGSTFPGAWTLVKANHIFAKATGAADYTGDEAVSLAGYSGRWIALRIDSTQGNKDYVGIAEIQVFASNVPIVTSGTPTVASATQATLAGDLVYDGGMPTTVFAHWGTTNGGESATAWQATTNLGVHATGAFSVTVPTSAGSGYFCRFSAVNDDGTNWSSAATFITAPVAVTSPGSVAEGAGSAVFTLTRPAAAADVDLALTFAVVGGTAAAWQDYLTPAGSVTLPAGSTNTQVTVTLLDDTDVESDETLVVVTSGAFPPTAASTNTLVIVDDESPIDPAAWSDHMDITLSGYDGATALTNFPFAVRLHEGLPGFAYADFGRPADGGDLCVTDPATELPLAYEIDTWNPSGTSVVWVSVPVLAGTNTKVRLHWGNTSRPPAPDTSQAVWAEGFGGVWHLGTPNPVDATWYANQGVGNANTTTNGVLGTAQHFNGTTAYMEVPDAPSIGAGVRAGLTVSLWMRSDYSFGTGEIQRMLEKGDSYFLLQRETAPLALLVKNGGTGFVAGSTASVASNVWHHVCGTFDGTTLRFYLNGVEAGSLPMAGLIDDDHLPLRIGSSDDGKYFTGALDEVRIESIPRSADWIKASFDNQRLGTAFATFRRFVYVPPTVIVIE